MNSKGIWKGLKKTDKKALRTRMITARARLSEKFVERASAIICSKLASTPQFKKAESILFYYPIGNEVDCRPAMENAFAEGKRVFLPRIRGWKFDIVEVKSFHSLDGMKKGELGVREPKGNSTPLEKIDLIVVPGVAFDGNGHRIGYGGGYYDVLLKKRKNKRPAAIGLCYSKLLLVRKIPCEAHDKQVDYIVSETKVIGCSKKGRK